MARPRKEVPVRLPFVPPLLRYVRARGGDAAELIRSFGLGQGAEERDACELAPSQFGELLAEACRQLRDPALCLKLPSELERRRYSLGELLAGSSRTLGEALERMVELSQANEGMELALERRGRHMAFV